MTRSAYNGFRGKRGFLEDKRREFHTITGTMRVLRIYGFIERGKKGVSRGWRLERKNSSVDGRHG